MLLLLALPALAAPLEPSDLPAPTGSWVVDRANVIDADDEAALDAVIRRLDESRRAQVAVVTVDEVVDTPKRFTSELFNQWGVGREGEDDGLMVVLVVGQRRLEMEPGYGLEDRLTDGWLGQMQSEQMVPHFKGGDYGAGLRAGLEAVEGRLEAEVPPEGSFEAPEGQPGGWLFAGALGLGLFGVVGFFALRPRTSESGQALGPLCPSCGGTMTLLSEDEEDDWLSETEQLEERVGGREHSVWCCNHCEDTVVVSERGYDPAVRACPVCDAHAVRCGSVVLRAPTIESVGLARVHGTCAACQAPFEAERELPRLDTVTFEPIVDPEAAAYAYQSSGSTWSHHSSSSSWSSGGGGFGGGGFGGGSSGGGGAGSSW